MAFVLATCWRRDARWGGDWTLRTGGASGAGTHVGACTHRPEHAWSLDRARGAARARHRSVGLAWNRRRAADGDLGRGRVADRATPPAPDHRCLDDSARVSGGLPRAVVDRGCDRSARRRPGRAMKFVRHPPSKPGGGKEFRNPTGPLGKRRPAFLQCRPCRKGCGVACRCGPGVVSSLTPSPTTASHPAPSCCRCSSVRRSPLVRGWPRRRTHRWVACSS